MKPTKRLIAALMSAADRIETDQRYDWYTSARCNCGILAQEILGLNEQQLDALRSPDVCGTWYKSAQVKVCDTTGLPLNGIFRVLREHGLELKDYEQLEHPPLAEYDHFMTKNKLEERQRTARYFRTLALQLEQQRKQENQEKAEKNYER